MIRFVAHPEIDRSAWDRCVASSRNRRIYGFTWYLDHVCPEWDALVEDGYAAVMPLTRNTKWRISYLYQPFFTQQLGIFSEAAITGPTVKAFLDHIPAGIRFAEIQLNTGNDYPLVGYNIRLKRNFELSLQKPYQRLKENYSQNVIRNLRKAEVNGIKTGRPDDIHALIALFRNNFGMKEGKLQGKHYTMLSELLSFLKAEGRGTVIGSFDQAGMVHAAAFLAKDGGRIYFLFAASSKEARDSGAMFHLVDTLVQENAGEEIILDFEGGQEEGIGRFYQSFGAVATFYPALRMNRLSLFQRMGFELAGMVRTRMSKAK